MEKTATNLLAAVAALVIVISTWAPVVTVPVAETATVATPSLA